MSDLAKVSQVSAKLCGCRRGEGCGLRWCRVLFELWETTVPQGTTGAVDGDQYWERFMPALMVMVVMSCCSLWWSCWWCWWWWWWCLWSWFSPFGLDHPSRTVTIQSLLSTGKGMGSTSCATVGSMPSWCCGGGAASAFCVLCLSLACLGKACYPVDSPLNIRFFFFHSMLACIQGHVIWFTFKCIESRLYVCVYCMLKLMAMQFSVIVAIYYNIISKIISHDVTNAITSHIRTYTNTLFTHLYMHIVSHCIIY